MRDKIKKFIEHSIPPGAAAAYIPRYMITGYICSVLFSFSFWHRYFEKYAYLFFREGDLLVLSGEMMNGFAMLYDGADLGFKFFAVWCVAFIIHYYTYYRQGSKSIYLMKRLPNRFEMHRRAVTVPIIMCVTFFIMSAVTTLIYFGLYLLITPNECLWPGQWQNLWRYLI